MFDTPLLGDILLSREQSVIISFHEAGHAVMAMANGFTVIEVSNVSTDAGMGQVKWQTPISLTEESCMRSVLVLASGMASDFIHWKSNGADESEYCLGHQRDRQQAELHLKELGDDGNFDIYLGIAIKFLEKPPVWKLVTFVADLMMTVGTVNGRDLIQNISVRVPKFDYFELAYLRSVLELSNRGL